MPDSGRGKGCVRSGGCRCNRKPVVMPSGFNAIGAKQPIMATLLESVAMRIPISCVQCSNARLNAEVAEQDRAKAAGEPIKETPGLRPLDPSDWYLADLEEDNAYVGTCQNGHVMRMSLQHLRYELLFESGVVAMLLRFHREAVSSIAAALERFYEFGIEVFSIRAGIDAEALTTAWNFVARQSERQLGAFAYLYLVNMRRPFLDRKDLGEYEQKVSFRNDVIHKGQFPNPDKTRDYARFVFELIRGTHAELQKLDQNAIDQANRRHLTRSRAAIEKKAGPPQPDKDGVYWGIGGAGFAMMLSGIQAEPADFESRLAEAEWRLPFWGFPVSGPRP